MDVGADHVLVPKHKNKTQCRPSALYISLSLVLTFIMLAPCQGHKYDDPSTLSYDTQRFRNAVQYVSKRFY